MTLRRRPGSQIQVFQATVPASSHSAPAAPRRRPGDGFPVSGSFAAAAGRVIVRRRRHGGPRLSEGPASSPPPGGLAGGGLIMIMMVMTRSSDGHGGRGRAVVQVHGTESLSHESSHRRAVAADSVGITGAVMSHSALLTLVKMPDRGCRHKSESPGSGRLLLHMISEFSDAAGAGLSRSLRLRLGVTEASCRHTAWKRPFKLLN